MMTFQEWLELGLVGHPEYNIMVYTHVMNKLALDTNKSLRISTTAAGEYILFYHGLIIGHFGGSYHRADYAATVLNLC